MTPKPADLLTCSGDVIRIERVTPQGAIVSYPAYGVTLTEPYPLWWLRACGWRKCENVEVTRK